MPGIFYDEVQTEEPESAIAKSQSCKISWLPFLRQIYVASGVLVIYFSLGLSFGAPTILISQMRREANSTDAVSHEMESWLSSVHGYASIPFVFIISISTQRYGRKIPFIIICLVVVAANILFYCSTNTMHILTSEILHGILLGGNITLLLPATSEYTSSHYRGMILTIKAACFYWGMWIANIVGTFFHWRNVGLVGLACCIYCLTSIFWPESPPWLAMKGRYEEAAAVHHWLKGYDETSEQELEDLLKSQREYHRTVMKRKTISMRDRIKLIKDTITTRSYYYPLLLAMIIMSLYHFSGKLVCMMYAVQLIHKITNDEETAYLGMLLLEGITVAGMSFGCFISKYLNRKTQLLGSTAIAISFLYIIALYLYLIYLGYFDEMKIASLALLSLFSICISCGPFIIASPILGEIVSMQYKCSTLLLLTVYAELLMATVLKLAPTLFRIFELHGAFFFYAVFATIFTVILYKFLPETKGKSFQEIEDYFRTPSNFEKKRLISMKI